LFGLRHLNRTAWPARFRGHSSTAGLCLNRQESMNMAEPTKEQVIHRAYELWEQAGKPEGRDQEFYHQAEKELKEGFERTPTVLPS
jgi:hypothetical protein